MTLYQLIHIAFEEIDLALHGTKTPEFLTPIQEFIDKTKKWRSTAVDSALVEDPASYWHRKCDNNDKIIQSCLNFLRKITRSNENLPKEAKDKLVQMQIGAVTLLRLFFSEEVQKCPRVSKRVDNLEALFILNELLQSFTPIGYNSQIVLDMFPVEFLDAMLEKHGDELHFEWFVKTEKAAYTPTERVKQLKDKIAARIESEAGLEAGIK